MPLNCIVKSCKNTTRNLTKKQGISYHRFLAEVRGLRMLYGHTIPLRTHSQKVRSLYKRACRNLESYWHARQLIRYHTVLLRERFDRNRCVREPAQQAALLADGEAELFSCLHPAKGLKFAKSPTYGGAFGRIVEAPDWVLDYWHPLEKAQYPEYFAKREQAKLEFIKFWEKEYGGGTGDGGS